MEDIVVSRDLKVYNSNNFYMFSTIENNQFLELQTWLSNIYTDKAFKGTVSVNSSDPLCKAGNAWFTMVLESNWYIYLKLIFSMYN